MHLKLFNGFETYEGHFRVCGIREKPAATLANQILLSKKFQENFTPVWKDRTDYDKYMGVNSATRSTMALTGRILGALWISRR